MTVAQSAFSAGARQHWLKALLAVSLALNLFFVAGALWVRLHPPAGFGPPEDRIAQIAGELDFNPAQKQAFERYAARMREQMQAMRKIVRPTIAAAWAEVASPHADEARVMRLLDDAAQERRNFARDMTTNTLAFLSSLSPDQRGRFVELLRRHRLWAPPPRQDAAR